ncbi:aspartyl protease family protein [Armatimonas rosea]|uniref:PDZ domain-containing protein n=1 Tax=Armatimonas rosea TaxID=685828 RepID=A0A7W9W928_ARMRO|nr:hypothetical protein [Armatimonas rosea]
MSERLRAIRQGTYLFLEAQRAGQKLLLCLDSGAGIHVVTPDAAVRLGIYPTNTDDRPVTGTAATVKARSLKLTNLTLGTTALADTDGVMVALPASLGGDGLLGYPLFAQLAVTLDYEAATVTLTPYTAFTPPANAASLPLRIVGNIPQVEVRLDGLAAWVELDTGSSGELDLNTPFVVKNEVKERYPKQIAMPTGVGVGGVTYGEVARAERLELGPFSLTKPLVHLSSQKSGADASSKVDGRIGGEILSRFQVTLDYAGKRLFLTPNTRFAEPFVFSRSGLLPIRESLDWVVFHVLPDSPASDSGIQAGDQLLLVDGRSAARLTASALNELLRRPTGTKIPLLLRAPSGRTRRVTLTLRELL